MSEALPSPYCQMYIRRRGLWQVSEGRIIAALRDEVTAAEARLEEERAAHTTTQRTAAAREQVPPHFVNSYLHI